MKRKEPFNIPCHITVINHGGQDVTQIFKDASNLMRLNQNEVIIKTK
jgi:hypothetical protein